MHQKPECNQKSYSRVIKLEHFIFLFYDINCFYPLRQIYRHLTDKWFLKPKHRLLWMFVLFTLCEYSHGPSLSHQEIPGCPGRTHICGGLCGFAQVQTNRGKSPAQRRSRTSRSSDSRWRCSPWSSCRVKGGRAQRLGVCAAHIWNDWPSEDREGATQVHTPQYPASEVSFWTFSSYLSL